MNTANLIGKIYTEKSFNSTNWESVCKVISEPFEDTGAQEMRVEVSVSFKGKNTTPFTYYPTVRSISKLFAILFIFLSFSLQAQTVVKMDSKGNYTAVAKTGQKTGSKAQSTGKTYTDAKGVQYPVMKSEKGRLFIIRQSAKSGKSYTQYLTIN